MAKLQEYGQVIDIEGEILFEADEKAESLNFHPEHKLDGMNKDLVEAMTPVKQEKHANKAASVKSSEDQQKS